MDDMYCHPMHSQSVYLSSRTRTPTDEARRMEQKGIATKLNRLLFVHVWIFMSRIHYTEHAVSRLYLCLMKIHCVSMLWFAWLLLPAAVFEKWIVYIRHCLQRENANGRRASSGAYTESYMSPPLSLSSPPPMSSTSNAVLLRFGFSVSHVRRTLSRPACFCHVKLKIFRMKRC